MYKQLIRPAFFRLDPENAHHLAMSLERLPLFSAGLRALTSFGARSEKVEAFGIQFPNRVGLAAGFDKDCEALGLIAAMGFGHIEVGSVTAEPQAGNPRPRIFRFPPDRALINRMGFPSQGAEVVAERLREIKKRCPNLPVIGVNIGKTKTVPIDDALADYQKSFRLFQDLGDYFVLNVSSPNTPELRKLQEPQRLRALFRGVNEENTLQRPLLVKLAPDLSPAELDEILECCFDCDVSGLIATNTTLTREGLSVATDEAGGLSGLPLRERSLAFVREIVERSEGKMPVIGVGGIASGEDAARFLDAGAVLVQLYTGLIYEGPFLVRRINAHLARQAQG